MSIAPGARLGSYEVLSRLGAGGMGEVWRARDTRLGRDVAIKVIGGLEHDPDRLARFRREAQLLASLNHPAIGAIHGFEETAGAPFLVLELVPGDTLADLLAKGPLPLEDALAIASQIAAALEAAHERGIVHRDLKPANVKVTPDGTVKLLDFGLAKALAGDAKESSGSDLTASPTLSARATQAGMILGTIAYMSPEQARGRAVDKRTDVWAFGVVLFEMLTGKRLFEGETVSDVLASVLKTAPDFAALPPDTPPNVLRVLRLCLQKDPRQRLHDIADARLELAEAAAEPASSVAGHAARSAAAGGRTIVPWALAGLLLAALAASLLTRPRSAPRRPIRFTISPPAGSTFATTPVLSADGSTLLYALASDAGVVTVWTRRLDTNEARALPVELADIRYPFWSPDGRSVAYSLAERIFRFDLAAARPQTVAPVALFFGGAWSVKGDILFVPFYGAGLQRVPASGGDATAVTAVDRKAHEGAHLAPRFLPDGRRFLYFARLTHDTGDREGWIVAGSLDEPKKLVRLRPADGFVGASDDALYFTIEGTLLAQRFDPRTLKLSGEPESIPGRVLHEGDTATVDASVARDGTLAFRSDPPRLRTLELVDRTGKTLRTIGAPAEYQEPVRLSPDGKRIAVARADERSALLAIWTIDVDGGAAVKLTSGHAEERFPVFLDDGKRLALATDRAGPYDVLVRTMDGSAPDLTLAVSEYDKEPLGATAANELFYSLDEPKGSRYVLQPAAAGAATRSLGGSGRFDATISRDGRWIAFTTTDTGRSEVYVRRSDAPGQKLRVSRQGGAVPRFRGDTGELYFVENERTLMSVAFGPDGPKGTPSALFAIPPAAFKWASYEPTADGQSFVLLKPVSPTIVTEITVIVNR